MNNSYVYYSKQQNILSPNKTTVNTFPFSKYLSGTINGHKRLTIYSLCEIEVSIKI